MQKRAADPPSASHGLGSNGEPDCYAPLAIYLTSGGFARPLRHHFTELRGPARPLFLLVALQRQRTASHILGDDAAGADIGAVADLDRGDQRRIRADERARADVRVVLVEAVVVAKDRARADVGAGADAAIAEIGQMIGLGALLDRDLLDLDEIADMHVLGEIGARPQPRKRADARAFADAGALDMAVGLDLGAILDGDAWAEEDVRLDHHVAADDRVEGHIDRVGIDQRRAVRHQARAGPALVDGFGLRQLSTRVDAEHLVFRTRHDGGLQSARPGDLDGIRQVVFALGIGVADRAQDGNQVLRAKPHDA